MAEERKPSPSSDGPAADPKPTVENRWWVDSTTGSERRRGSEPAADRPPPLVGARLFGVGRDFDQDRAKARLTNSNLNLLREANPPENGWGYLQMTSQRSSRDLIERVKRRVRLPPGARGVIVDSGSSLRVIVTGQPAGERLVELTLGGSCSLDAWIGEDWVRERVFRGRERALREASGLIARTLRSERIQ